MCFWATLINWVMEHPNLKTDTIFEFLASKNLYIQWQPGKFAILSFYNFWATLINCVMEHPNLKTDTIFEFLALKNPYIRRQTEKFAILNFCEFWATLTLRGSLPPLKLKFGKKNKNTCQIFSRVLHVCKISSKSEDDTWEPPLVNQEINFLFLVLKYLL
jgi:hypothetical protein